MTFEKEFKDLSRKYEVLMNRGREIKAIRQSKTEYFNDFGGISKDKLLIIKQQEVSLISDVINDFKEHCLDKARVKEALDWIEQFIPDSSDYWNGDLGKLDSPRNLKRKELGL